MIVNPTEFKKDDFFLYRHNPESDVAFWGSFTSFWDVRQKEGRLLVFRYYDYDKKMEMESTMFDREFPGVFELLNGDEPYCSLLFSQIFPGNIEQYLTHELECVRIWAKTSLPKRNNEIS